MSTHVVNRKHTHIYEVYIGRPSKWGNPYKIGPDGDRRAVIAKYFTWLQQQPGLLADLPELRGKILGCWCKPQPCHGDLLAYMADHPEIDFRLFRQFPIAFL